MNNIIKDIDYKRIRKTEEIKKKYFNELPEVKHNVFFAYCFFIGGALSCVVSILLFLIEIISFLFNIKKNHYNFFGNLAILIFLLIIPGLIESTIKEKKHRKKMILEKNLTVEFFLDKLEEADLEVSTEELKIYEIFLDRYIEYCIFETPGKLNYFSKKYFNKEKASLLTTEELFISAIVYPTYSSFIYEALSAGGD